VKQSSKCINLEEGEMICDKCEGSGTSWIYTTPCSKCQGQGKVDWVENIVGKKPLYGSDSSSSVNFKHLMQAVIQSSKQLANKIDQEIMETLVAKSEQTNKIKAAAVLYGIRRDSF